MNEEKKDASQEPQAVIVSVAPADATIEYCYGNGWQMMWKYFPKLLLIGIVGFLLAIPGQIPVLGLIYSAFFIFVLAGGLAYVLLKASRNEKPQLSDIFVAFKTNYWNTLLAIALTALLVFGGLRLLIVPGIFFLYKLAFVPYLVVDKKMRAMEAVRKSWQMTAGHSLTILFILLFAIPIVIAGASLKVGIVPAVIWIGVASASMYRAVDKS